MLKNPVVLVIGFLVLANFFLVLPYYFISKKR